MRYGFIFVALAIFISFNAYVITRGWQALPSASALRPIYMVSLIALFLMMLGTMIFGNALPQPVAKVVSFVGFTYFILVVYLLISFLLVDGVRIANYFIHFAPAGMQIFRLWAMVGTLGIISIALVWGNYRFNHPQIVTLNLSTDKPKQNKTLKIVAASDIHLGISIDKKKLQRYVQMINDQHPDIVLLAGDVSDRSIVPVIRQNMAEELRAIKAPLGVYAINGNHELYAETPNATAEYLKTAGIKVLRDEVSLVDSSFYVVGRDDRTNTQRKNLSELVTGVDKNKMMILLDHQPYHLQDAEQNSFDLQISGHTHNGQFFPGNIAVKRMYELGYGYLKKGKTHYYVSSGLGIWGPQYRIGTQSELVVINLKY
ncbi:MAG: metallophosphoesterase [Paludibacter sp.]|nr:metallophosphoesterase [Paludibacter sp.]